MVQFRVTLPSALDAAIKIRGDDIIEIDELHQTSHVVKLAKSTAFIHAKSTLSESFEFFFADSQALIRRLMSNKTNTLDQFLLLSAFFNGMQDEKNTVPG